MTEAEWFGCSDPEPMLDVLREKSAHGVKQRRLSERKLRLFACACYRRVWSQVEVGDREIIAATELYVDGALPFEQLNAVYLKASGGVYHADRTYDWDYAQNDSWKTLDLSLDRDGEALVQASLLRDIAGNPFYQPYLERHWLSWNGRTIGKIAEEIYQHCAFERMPILGDALEEAGCSDTSILKHCRGGGPHVRGCWVIDLLTGRD